MWHLDCFKDNREVYGPAYCTALYEWTVHKQAILVVLHATAKAAAEDPPCVTRISMVPFSNEFSYDNRAVWPRPVESLEYVLDGQSFGHKYMDFYNAKCTKYHIHETLRPPHEWWLNGHLLCNTTAPWGTRGLETLHTMLHEAFMGRPVWRGMWPVFFINRRDFPHRTRCDRSPFLAFPSAHDVPIAPSALAPVVSFYTGPQFRDLVWPTPEAWTNAGREWPAPVWPKKLKAVFRGTLTGHHIDLRNARLQVVDLGIRRPDLLDAALTGWTQRDRLEWPRVVYNGPLAVADHLPHRRILSFSEPMSIEEQMAYAVLIYVPGHVAAERLDWYLRTGCCVVVVDDPACVAPTQFADTVGQSEYDGLANGLHYVRTTVDELEVTLAKLLADPERVERFGRAAHIWASRRLCRASMVGAMRQTLIA